MEDSNVKCPFCKNSLNDIYTHCPFCGADTGGEALCLYCDATLFQLEYWESGNCCEKCKPVRSTSNISDTKKLFAFSEDFSNPKNPKIWRRKIWLLRGQTMLEDQQYVIRNRYGWRWTRAIPMKPFNFRKSFLIKTQLEIRDISANGYFGISFGRRRKAYRFLLRGTGEFKIEENFNKGEHKISIGGSKLSVQNNWVSIPNFHPMGSSSVLVEVYYNRKRGTFNFYLNSEKIAFSLPPFFSIRSPFVGFVTKGKETSIGVRSLFVRNLRPDYVK